MESTFEPGQLLSEFAVTPTAAPYGNGHINDTYVCEMPRYIIQRINTRIFKDPDALMDNIVRVTAFLREKLAAAGEDPARGTLTVIPTRGGRPYLRVDDEHVYRVYAFIEGTVTVENCSDPVYLAEAGRGYGRFQKMLADFPAETLHETIPDFHDTPKRLAAFEKAVATDKAGRAAAVEKEIAFVRENADLAPCVTEGLCDGRIPLRVTHNDTKMNNILFDAASKKAVCVIDLDTVMPGSALYDFGDALRLGGSSAAEDEVDLSKVFFREEAFKAFASGYFAEMKASLTDAEKALLPRSVALMTYECGMRFLTDYLEGDVYFKVRREEHNLDRARNQFKLVADMREKEKELLAFVKTL